jgi:3-oxoadipate enol-lactonase
LAETPSNFHSYRRGYAHVRGTELYYEIQGSGYPLVLIHAGVVDHRMWDDQFEIFSQQYRVLRYDVRGYGRSKSPPGDYSDFGDLYYLLTFLGITQTAILGISLGGRVAINFTLRYPSMVSTLVLAAPGLDDYPFTTEFLKENTIQLRQAAEAGNIEGMIEWFQRSWTDGPHRTPDQVDANLRARIHTMALEGPRPQDKLGQNQPLRPSPMNRLAEIRVSTLCVVGDLDMPEILEIVDRLVGAVPLVEKVVINGVAHMVNMEQPASFNQIVLDFLTRTIPSPQGNIGA